MSIGKYISLEEARKRNELKRFIKEHSSRETNGEVGQLVPKYGSNTGLNGPTSPLESITKPFKKVTLISYSVPSLVFIPSMAPLTFALVAAPTMSTSNLSPFLLILTVRLSQPNPVK